MGDAKLVFSMNRFDSSWISLVALLFVMSGLPTSIAQPETGPPEVQPPTTLDRLEGEVEQEGVINQQTYYFVWIAAILVALALVVSLIIAFRRGREDLSDDQKHPPPK